MLGLVDVLTIVNGVRRLVEVNPRFNRKFTLRHCRLEAVVATGVCGRTVYSHVAARTGDGGVVATEFIYYLVAFHYGQEHIPLGIRRDRVTWRASFII